MGVGVLVGAAVGFGTGVSGILGVGDASSGLRGSPSDLDSGVGVGSGDAVGVLVGIGVAVAVGVAVGIISCRSLELAQLARKKMKPASAIRTSATARIRTIRGIRLAERRLGGL